MSNIGEFGRPRQENMETVAEILLEQHLPGVFQYVHSWIDSIETAEELALAALKKTLAAHRAGNTDPAAVFAAARSLMRKNLPRGACRSGFECLSPHERDVLSLKLDGELDNRTIAKLTGCSETAVGKMVVQCLVKLRDKGKKMAGYPRHVGGMTK